jgi:ABC-2 type transport system permease protein
MRDTLRFLRALVSTNLKASFALRGAFWLQAVFMAANNVVFFATWWIFFDRFEEVGGWRLSDLMTLFGVVAAGFGLSVVLAGGVRDLARAIAEGELDAILTQPKHPLVHAVASRTLASGWGDLATGVAFLAAAGEPSALRLGAAAAAVLSSAVVFTAAGVVLQSLAFWLGRIGDLPRQLWEFLLTFSLYPGSLFSGALRFLLATALPAFFVGHLPAELVRAPSGSTLAWVVGAAVVWAAIAARVFARGLRRYESGNRFGART